MLKILGKKNERAQQQEEEKKKQDEEMKVEVGGTGEA